jgi:hypothetical protein
MEVIAKYTKVDVSKVKVDLHVDNKSSVLELNVALPESEKETKKTAKKATKTTKVTKEKEAETA